MPPSRRSPTAIAGAGASWLALVAATTFGAGTFDCVRAEVRGDGLPSGKKGEVFRLVVQSYASSAVDAEGPLAGARPLGAVHRAITAEELSRGVSVDLVNVRDSAVGPPHVVAWIEGGPADLELDGLLARPAGEAFAGGEAAVEDGRARVVLRPRA